MIINKKDTEILQDLAKQLAAIAASDQMEVKRKLWRDINELKAERPAIVCSPENGWNEIVTQGHLKCESQLARKWESLLRREIFWGSQMGDDRPTEPCFNVFYTAEPDDWGLPILAHQSQEGSGSRKWDEPLQNYERDLPKLKFPDIRIDYEVSNSQYETARQIFEPILQVRLKGSWWWSLGITEVAMKLRGMTNIFMDMIDKPDELKEFLSFISRAILNKLDYLEENGLLFTNSGVGLLGSGGCGYTSQLPTEVSGKVKCSDMWGFSESQETVSVSPDMYEEFVFPYEKPILDRFGLTAYGCCEAIDPRWNIVKQHHNLRRVSCSPWCNYEKMSELLGRKYVYSMKVNPSPLSVPDADFDQVRSELRRLLEITRGNVVEILLKDTHTIGGGPKNATTWCRIAKEEIERVY